MGRPWMLAIAAAWGMALNLLGIFVLDLKPLSTTDLLLLIFISAWAGEQTTTHVSDTENSREGNSK